MPIGRVQNADTVNIMPILSQKKGGRNAINNQNHFHFPFAEYVTKSSQEPAPPLNNRRN